MKEKIMKIAVRFMDNFDFFKLKKVESRILEIITEKPARIHNLNENYTENEERYVEIMDIEYLDVEREELEYKRRIILDNRNSTRARILWNIVVPIIVTVITTILISKFT